MLQLPCPAYGDLDLEIRTLWENVTESAAWIGVHGTVNIGSASIADECAAELRSHDGRHATGTTDFELYISMFVPQSSGCFPLCLSLHGTCRALAQMYILVTHMIALQLPFYLTTVGPLAPYKSCVSHPCIARACTDCDPTIWFFFILFHSIHRWEMEMKILLSDTRFDADDVRFVLLLEGQFTCKPESRSQKVELFVVKVNSHSVVLGTWQTVRVDVLSWTAQTC